MTSRLIRDLVKRRLAPFPALTRLARLGYVSALNVRLEAGAALRYLAARGQSGKAAWETLLPVQPPSRVRLPVAADALWPDALLVFCRSRGLACGVGGDALYLPPATWASSPLSELQRRYPEGCGIKIARTPGGAEHPYMTARFGRYMAARMSYPHSKQLLTYNFLYANGIAPRLHDLVEIETANGELRVCYVVEHVVGEALAEGDRAQIVASLQDLERRGLLKLISAAGWSGIDFQEPDGNGNIIRSASRHRPLYIDIHNFTLPGYCEHLGETWRAVAADVPAAAALTNKARAFYARLLGTPVATTLEGRERAELGLRLLAQAQLPMAERLVFVWPGGHPLESADVLRHGARWLHVFDMAAKLPALERLLLALGCTRFSLAARPDMAQSAAPAPLPPHLRGTSAAGSLLHYRTGPQEGEWASAALGLPWQYMLYEHDPKIGPLSARLDALAAGLPIRLRGCEPLPGETPDAAAVVLIERTGA